MRLNLVRGRTCFVDHVFTSLHFTHPLNSLARSRSVSLLPSGYAECVSQERISDDELILITNPKVHSSSSIILRGT